MDRELQKDPAQGITFAGTIDKSKHIWHYEVRVRGLHFDTMCNSLHVIDNNGHGDYDIHEAILCSGVANGFLGKLSRTETIAWGYAGTGPELLAVSLLTYSCAVRKANSNNVRFSYYDTPPVMEARKHCKAFTKEIVSKLPDSWKMSAAEVLAWVDKQKQPTTPEVKHEREEQIK